MPDALGLALAQISTIPGLGWLVVAAFVAGTVRGFAGFGTGLIYMPVAAQVLPPLWAIITVTVMDIFGPVPNVPVALRTADKSDLARLLAGTAIALPLGLMLLSRLDAEIFRIAVSVTALVTLGCLLVGLRYRGRLGPGLVLGTGGMAGFLGGVSGLPGPPVILLYMASSHPAAVVRASTMVYLWLYDILLMLVLALKSVLMAVPVLVGLGLALPNLLGNLTGAVIFRPGQEPLYRGVAYLIIAASALSGLPFWE